MNPTRHHAAVVALVVSLAAGWVIPTPGWSDESSGPDEGSSGALRIVCPSVPYRALDDQIELLGESGASDPVEVVDLDRGVVVARHALMNDDAFRMSVPLAPYRVNRLAARTVSTDGTRTVVELPAITQGEPFEPGVIHIKLRSVDLLETVLARHSATLEDATQMFGSRDPSLARWYSVRVTDGSEYERVLEYQADPDVLAANLAFLVSQAAATDAESTAATPWCRQPPGDTFESPNDLTIREFERRMSAGGSPGPWDHGSPRIVRHGALADVIVASANPPPHDFIAPILAVDGDCDPPLPPPVDAALTQAYGPHNSTITPIIFGGPTSVDDCVARTLQERYGYEPNVARFAGAERCATSVAAVADSTASNVVLAGGAALADAAAAAAVARQPNWALLLTGPRLCPEAIAWLQTRAGHLQRLVVAGGKRSVSEDVVRAAHDVGAFTAPAERYGGATRLQTAVRLAEALFTVDPRLIHLVHSQDTLGAALSRQASLENGPVIYFGALPLDGEIKRYVDAHIHRGGGIHLFGHADFVTPRLEIEWLHYRSRVT